MDSSRPHMPQQMPETSPPSSLDTPRRVLYAGAEDAGLADSLATLGVRFEIRRVGTPAACREALSGWHPELVLFDAAGTMTLAEVLELMRGEGRSLPLVLMADHLSAAEAVEAMRGGATDCVAKGEPGRLAAALQRALADAELRRAERNAEIERLRIQRYDDLAQMVKLLSHELRNILQPLMLVSGVLKRNPAENVRSLAELIDSSAQRGLDVTAAMLNFASDDGGVSERTTLGRLAAAIRTLLPGGVPNNVQFEVAPDAADMPLEGKVAELQKCLLNLCRNGLQAMPDGGKLRLDAQRLQLDAAFFGDDEPVRPGPYVCVSVQDSGKGISAKASARLFAPFFTTRKGAAGLGLLSCQRIVAAHRGLLRLHSEAGRGTRAEIYLPEAPQP